MEHVRDMPLRASCFEEKLHELLLLEALQSYTHPDVIAYPVRLVPGTLSVEVTEADHCHYGWTYTNNTGDILVPTVSNTSKPSAHNMQHFKVSVR